MHFSFLAHLFFLFFILFPFFCPYVYFIQLKFQLKTRSIKVIAELRRQCAIIDSYQNFNLEIKSSMLLKAWIVTICVCSCSIVLDNIIQESVRLILIQKSSHNLTPQLKVTTFYFVSK